MSVFLQLSSTCYCDISIVPTASPSSLRLEIVPFNQVEVSWSPPHEDFQNGILTHYTICLREETGENCISEILHSATSLPLSVVLPNLSPDTVYRVRVRAHTSVGSGPYSPDVLFTTGLLTYWLPNFLDFLNNAGRD